MSNPIAKTRRILEVGETKFEFAVSIRDEPLLGQAVRITNPGGQSLDVTARELFQFAAEAFVIPLKIRALKKAIEDDKFEDILLNKI